MKITKIDTLDKLKACLDKHKEDFFIQLNYGIRSSKQISWVKKGKEKQKYFGIYNNIDDSYIVLTEKEIMNPEKTNIGVAMKMGSFYSIE